MIYLGYIPATPVDGRPCQHLGTAAAALLTWGGQGLPFAPDYPARCLHSAAFWTFDALSQLVNHGKFVVILCRGHATPSALPDGHSEKSNIAEGRKDDPI
jgi:hypothetical protein